MEEVKDQQEQLATEPAVTPNYNPLKAYIGAKIILAEPMDEVTFLCKFKGHERKSDSCETQMGFHVIYANPDGDYHSWSPASVFPFAYREVQYGEASLISRVMPQTTDK